MDASRRTDGPGTTQRGTPPRSAASIPSSALSALRTPPSRIARHSLVPRAISGLRCGRGRCSDRCGRCPDRCGACRAGSSNALLRATDGVGSRDGADGLGSALAENQSRSGPHVLGVADEAEAGNGLVAGAQVVAVHADDRRGLADRPAVDHRLVLRADGGGVVQDKDLSLKLPRGTGVQRGRHHDHTLADGRALNLLQRERRCLPAADLLGGETAAVDALDRDRREVARRVRAQQQRVVDADRAGDRSAGHNRADARHGVGLVDLELRRRVAVEGRAGVEKVQEHLQQGQPGAGNVGHVENGADAIRDEVGGGDNDIILVGDQQGHLAAARALEDLLQQDHGLLQHVGRADVDLGDDHKHRDVQRQCKAKMLSRHANDTHVGADHQHCELGRVPRQPKHRRLEVLLVAGKIDERDDLGGAGADVGPVELPIVRGRVHDAARAVEAKDVVRHTACAPAVRLVLVAEELLARASSAIVQLAVGENPEECALARVDISNNGDTDLDEVITVAAQAHKILCCFTLRLITGAQKRDVCLAFCGELLQGGDRGLHAGGVDALDLPVTNTNLEDGLARSLGQTRAELIEQKLVRLRGRPHEAELAGGYRRPHVGEAHTVECERDVVGAVIYVGFRICSSGSHLKDV
eukprot:m.225017 g.225017  ORF g.225017 m.225017 type:complete len:640 (+) comp11193_c0_seq1:93-2012(+)